MIIEDEKKQMCELSHTKSNKVDVMTKLFSTSMEKPGGPYVKRISIFEGPPAFQISDDK